MSLARSKPYFFLAWAVAFAYMGLIFWLSHQPSVPMPMKFQHQDKLFHFAAYFGLGFLLAHAFSGGGSKRRFIWAFFTAAAYGISDEFHQSFVPGRDASFLDWVADAAGAWFGAYTYLRGEKWRSMRETLD